MDIKNWSIDFAGKTLSVEVGRLSKLANGSCVVRYGDTMILATAIMSSSTRDGIDFFPLSVEFEERMYAAGKIKGSRFIKREGRPSDEAVLTGRLIDRAIRPLFDSRVRNEVQVILTALSVDPEVDTQIPALIAASTALHISSIPWAGPIAAARVCRVEKQLIVNLNNSEKAKSDTDIIVAGTPEKLIMTEAGCLEIPDEDVVAAMQFGCLSLKPVLEMIEKIRSEVGKEKVDLFANPNENALSLIAVEKKVDEFIKSKVDEWIFDSVKADKTARVEVVDRFSKAIEEMLKADEIVDDVKKIVLSRVKLYVEKYITLQILDKEQRLDGRKLTDIRPLGSEVGLLPRTHGSAMFYRGDTQVLSVVTLGSPGDAQILDSMEEDGEKRYMHHYNDTPASYGETGRMGGPGRRAIGHGALAERALVPVIPAKEDFPYVIRVVSEVLGSNGSSSMASTCGSTLALMDAGVPIKKPVAGIAMGLASDESGRYKVLTDLQDIEDGPGGMDFKITGTADGVTAIQMDTKTAGLSWEIVKQTFKQSKEARLRVLDSILATLPNYRSDLSEYAPRIETIIINPEKIGTVIGPGGKMIKKIVEETGAQIDIEDDGRVFVTTNNPESMAKAKQWIKNLTHEVTAGEIYDGTVVRLEDFGAFVEILPGKDGLVHVSEIAYERTEKPSDVLKLGDKVKVKVREIDNMGRVNLSMKELLPKPEGYVERPRLERPPRDNNRGGRRPFGGRGR